MSLLWICPTHYKNIVTNPHHPASRMMKNILFFSSRDYRFRYTCISLYTNTCRLCFWVLQLTELFHPIIFCLCVLICVYLCVCDCSLLSLFYHFLFLLSIVVIVTCMYIYIKWSILSVCGVFFSNFLILASIAYLLIYSLTQLLQFLKLTSYSIKSNMQLFSLFLVDPRKTF